MDALNIATFVDVVHVDPQLHAAAWALLKARADKQWSLVDASSFVIMGQLGISEALTTDHHFVQAGIITLPTP